jgi:competence protein ComEA
MNINNKPLREWFGYSRRERRATFILFIILIIVILLRYLVPQKDTELEDLSKLLVLADDVKDSLLSPTADTAVLYKFDPNSASYDTLTALGLSEKQARTIMSYRNKGGMFRQPSDIKRIYGIDGSTSARLIPYIEIEKNKGRSVQKQAGTISDQKKREKIDLNSADSAALVRLPGIRPVLSSRIIKYRKLLGGFVSAEQLKEVYGLNEETYKLLEKRVFADSSNLTRININGAGFKELSKHPYLNRYDVQAIMKFRVIKGRISDMGELVENKILSEVKAKRISPYFKF